MKGNASKILLFLVFMIVIGSSACTALLGTPEPPTPAPTVETAAAASILVKIAKAILLFAVE